MNFTPRSVAMGNSMTKAYKLHVKFESGGKKSKCLSQVEMSKNKTHNVNLSTGKETFSCLPDTSVGQLKGKIGAKFQVISPSHLANWSPVLISPFSLQVPPSQLVLFCNGKLLQGDDYQTLRQARVCSGSKILVNRLIFPND